MEKTIYFDMDGTIADLYGVDNWLPMLVAEDVTPYAIAKPMVDTEELTKTLKELKMNDYKIGIVSWLSKSGTEEYNNAVRNTKKDWLKKYIGVEIDEMHIVKYGTRKDYIVKNKMGILFDDEEPNRNHWKGLAINPQEENILEILKNLLTNSI